MRLLKLIFQLIYTLIRWTVKALIVFLFICLAGAFFDYIQLKNENFPVFYFSNTYNGENQEVFQGLFHKIHRTIYASFDESLNDSKNITYQFFTMTIPITYKSSEEQLDFSIETTEASSCTEEVKLYYKTENIKVYTYCLEEIKIKRKTSLNELNILLEKDISILEDIENSLAYTGIVKEKAFEFISREDNFTNLELKMYRCNEENSKDIYLGTKDMNFHEDFCNDNMDKQKEKT